MRTFFADQLHHTTWKYCAFDSSTLASATLRHVRTAGELHEPHLLEEARGFVGVTKGFLGVAEAAGTEDMDALLLGTDSSGTSTSASSRSWAARAGALGGGLSGARGVAGEGAVGH